jgi:hypothetical protein
MFAAGWRTGVYHYDGQAWSLMDAPDELAVWGLLWGTASDNVYAGGDPDLWHYDGTTWTALNWNRGARSLVGRGPTDIWGLTRYRNEFVRYDGAGWRAISFATVWFTEPVSLNAMALDSTGTVYAAGSNGAMARHAPDASSYQWQLERVGVSRDPITALWSARPFDVFAGSGGGPISRGQEGEWAGVAYIGFGAMDLWGTSDRNVYAVGQRSLMRWNGSRWREVDIGSPTLTAIWGSGPDDIFLAGLSRVLHYNGDTWSGRLALTPLYDVWGASSDQVWAVGGRAGSTETAEILFYDGSRWRRQSTFDGGPLRAVWGTSPADIFAVGEGGLILHYDGESWSDMASPTSGDLTDLWGSAPDDVYAVGDDGAFHYDGSGWSRLAGAPPGDYESVWGSSMGPVHFGTNGRIISAHR